MDRQDRRREQDESERRRDAADARATIPYADPAGDRFAWSGGLRYQQARRQPGYARQGAFDSRSARGDIGGPRPDPSTEEASYGSTRYGQLAGTSAAGRGDAPRGRSFGGLDPDDEAWLQDQGYPRLGRHLEARTIQIEHGPYAGGTQQGGPAARSGALAGRATAGPAYGPSVPPGPYAGRGPRGYRRSDDRILEDVCEQLAEHPAVDASEVDVEVRDGEVLLRGMVPDRRMRRLAEEVAERVAGVRDVVNQLRAPVRSS